LIRVTSTLMMFAFFERLVVGNAVADLVVDRSADGFGVGVMPPWRIVQRRRDGSEHLRGVGFGQAVEFVGGDAWF